MSRSKPVVLVTVVVLVVGLGVLIIGALTGLPLSVRLYTIAAIYTGGQAAWGAPSQLRLIWKQRQAASLSRPNLIMTIMGMGAWSLVSLIDRNLFIFIPNAVGAGLYSCVLVLAEIVDSRQGQSSSPRPFSDA